MSSELDRALRDLALHKGLRRLRTARRLRELNGPKVVVEDSEALLEKTRKELGARWAEVEVLYPEFLEWANGRDAAFAAWESRCESCSHWVGTDHLSYSEDEVTPASDDDTWCGIYRVGTRTIPEPCPEHKLLQVKTAKLN